MAQMPVGTAARQDPPKVVDSKLNPIVDVFVGNGSKVNVSYRPFEWSFGNKSGVSAGLNSIQVLDLIEYNPSGSSSEFAIEDGYTNDIDNNIPFAAA